MTKVSIIGAGKVGEIIAFGLSENNICQKVVLLDIVEGLPQGKGLDIYESSPISQSSTTIIGTNNPEDIEGSDIVVIPAGVPRKPGMDRMDLLKINLKICKSVINNVRNYAPDSIIIYVANPVDVMTFAALKISGFDPKKVFGMAGILDTSRYKTFISMATGISQKDISAMVLGGHGDAMVPFSRYTTISGIPLKNFLDTNKINKIIERTRKGGGEIVNLLGYSAYYAPGKAVVEMIEAIIKDQKRLLPCVAYLQGEYGFNDIYAGVPCVLGKEGIERIVEIDLNEEEREAMKISLTNVKKGTKEMKELLNSN